MNTIPQEQLTRWAYECFRINHLHTLVLREIAAGDTMNITERGRRRARAKDLTERARQRTRELFNELIAAGASQPPENAEPELD